MAAVPQVYPLWLAEVRGAEVYTGRVVAWQVHEAPTAPGRPAATPIVAFTTPDGLLLETAAPQGALSSLADTRDEAVAAARGADAPEPGDPPRTPRDPPPPDDEDDRRPPDPRTRLLTLRRLGMEEPAAQQPGPAAGRTQRRDR